MHNQMKQLTIYEIISKKAMEDEGYLYNNQASAQNIDDQKVEIWNQDKSNRDIRVFGDDEDVSKADKNKNKTFEFKLFLDGSRYVYHINDFSSKDKRIYPIHAAQIGAACCMRKGERLVPYEKCTNNVIAWPNNDSSSKNNEEVGYPGFEFTYFETSLQQDPKATANETIRKEMVKLENKLIEKSIEKTIKQNHQKNFYLVKDGDIPYDCKADIQKKIIGLAKSFDTCSESIIEIQKYVNKKANLIASLEKNHRTPISWWRIDSQNDEKPTIMLEWYLRLQDIKRTKNVFDGVVKIQKAVYNVSSDFNFPGKYESKLTKKVNAFSLAIIDEKNPSCFGSDTRWANHIYPIYLTEQYIKSQFENKEKFLHIFRSSDGR